MTRSNKSVVIITGVSSGIGLAAAQLFSARGWLVVGTVREREFPVELATSAVDTQMAEMTRPADLARVVNKTLETYGRLDAVIANAGYGLWGELESLSYAQIADQLAVNLTAVAELARLAIKPMKQQKKGVIIGLSSVAGLAGLPGASVYSASKHGLEGLLESLHYELATSGIKVRLIEPGSISTSFWQNRRWGKGKPSPEVKSNQFATSVTKLVELIYESATSPARRLRYKVGLTRIISLGKRLLPESLWDWLVQQYYHQKHS